MEDFGQSSGKTVTDSQIRTRLLQVKEFFLSRSPLPGASIIHAYRPSESTLSRISEAPSTGVFVGVFIIANHERAVVLYCYKSNAGTRKYFNNGGRRRYHSSKNKKIRDRVDPSVQFSGGELGWRSGESARLPPMCPVICGLSLLLVLAPLVAPRVFLRVLRFPSLLKNQHFQIPIRLGIRGPRVCQSKDCYVLPSLNKVNLFIYFYSVGGSGL